MPTHFQLTKLLVTATLVFAGPLLITGIGQAQTETATAQPAPASLLPAADYQMVWHDEFDGPQLDASRWAIRQPGLRVGGYNVAENTKLDGQGHLLVSVKREAADKITSSMISTEGKFTARYGYYECRVKLQKQQGCWSAFWLQSPTVSTVGDTRVNGTEVDIYEYAVPMGNQTMSNLHWDGYGADHKTTGLHYTVEGLTEGYHTFGCEWTPAKYRFFTDGKLMWESTAAPSNRPQYIILSTEVPVAHQKHWAGKSEEFLGEDQVTFDYVRVYQTPEQKALNAAG